MYRNPAVSFQPSAVNPWKDLRGTLMADGWRALSVKSIPMIPQDLLDILVCPVCKKPLALKDEGQTLKCGECRRAFPIRDGIPILLVDEAVTEPS